MVPSGSSFQSPFSTVGAAWKEVEPAFFQFKENAGTYGYFKSEGFIGNLSGVAVRIDLTGVKVDVKTFFIANRGFNMRLVGGYIRKKAVCLALKGIFSWA